MFKEILRDYLHRVAPGTYPGASPVIDEDFLRRALVGKFARNRDSGPGQPPLMGTYNTLADAADRELFQRAGEDLRSMRHLIVPVGVAGQVGGFPIDCDANGIMLFPRVMQNGTEIESSDSARVYAFINNNVFPIPFSYNLAPQGSGKGDATFFGGRINRLNFVVQNPTLDVQNQPYLIFVLLRNATLMGSFGAAQLYGSPSGAGNASGGSVTPSTSGAAPAASPSSPSAPVAPSGDPGGGGFIGGGGGPINPIGGGGGGRGNNKL